MTIYLYVKTHNKTGMKYLGKTAKPDPHKYPGSGKRWTRHLKKHGYDYTTEILLATDNAEELKETGLYFSELWNVVESNEWANLMPETGSGGDNAKNIDYKKLFETRKNNGKTWKQTEESNLKRSLSHRGKKKSDESIRKTIEGKRRNGTDKHTEKTKRKISKTNKGVSKPFGEEHLRAVRKRLEIHNERKVECPYCSKKGQYANMKRWHFDNCKHNPNSARKKETKITCTKCGYTTKQSPNFYKHHNERCKNHVQSVS